MTATVNLTIEQGKTFTKALRWGQSLKTYKPITAITNAAPCILTVPSHGMPDGWAFQIEGIRDMTTLNSDDNTYYAAKVVDPNTLELNAIDSTHLPVYTGGGILSYNTPVDLTGYTARMQIREAVDSTTVLVQMDTTNGGIVIDTTNRVITLQQTAAQTAAYTWTDGVYDLEMVSGSGLVYALVRGAVSVVLEVTR